MNHIVNRILNSPLRNFPGSNHFAYAANTIWRSLGGGLSTDVNGDRMYAHVSPRELLYAPPDAGEPHVMRVWRNLIKEGDYVADIGSGVGVYAIHAAQLVGQGGTVWAVEPDRAKIATLARTVAHGDLGIICVPFAAYDEPGVESWDGIEMRTQPLDNIIPRVDIIKMDIEGFEDKAIRGLKRRLADDEPVLVLEWHEARVANPDQARHDLEELGYDIFEIEEDRIVQSKLGNAIRYYVCSTEPDRLDGIR